MRIQDLIAETHPLTGKGKYLRGLEHNSLVVNTEKNLFYWNKKQIFGDSYDWLTKVLGLPDDVARSRLVQFKPTISSEVLSLLGNEVVNLAKVDTDLPNLFWEAGQKRRDYWYNRMLTDKIIDRFKLGYYNGWFTIPLYLNDSLYNIQLRREIPDKRILSWYSGKHPVMFNEDVLEYSRVVFLTEGPVDAMLLTQYGFPALSHNGGAGYWTDTWFSKFRRVKEVFILYDNDDAGIKGAVKVASVLGEYRCKLINYCGRKKGYDTVDFFRDGNTLKDFEAILENEYKRGFHYGETKATRAIH